MNRPENIYWTDKQIRVSGQGPDGPFSIELAKPSGLIGSHAKADVVLKGPGISRRHLYVHATDRGVFVVDLTQAAEQKKRAGVWAEPGQPIVVGGYQLELGFVDHDSLPAAPELSLFNQPAKRPYAILNCETGETQLGRRYLSSRLSLVGRDKNCAFQFTTRSISPQHCVLYEQDGSVWTIDLRSSGKTRINGKPAKIARLRHKANVQVGRVQIQFRMAGDNGSRERWKSGSSTSLETQSADKLPEDASVDEASLDEASMDEASMDEASMDEASVDESSMDDASMDEASSMGGLDEPMLELKGPSPKSSDLDRLDPEMTLPRDESPPSRLQLQLEESNRQQQLQIAELEAVIERLKAHSRQQIAQVQTQLLDAQLALKDRGSAEQKEVARLNTRLQELEQRSELWQQEKDDLAGQVRAAENDRRLLEQQHEFAADQSKEHAAALELQARHSETLLAEKAEFEQLASRLEQESEAFEQRKVVETFELDQRETELLRQQEQLELKEKELEAFEQRKARGESELDQRETELLRQQEQLELKEKELEHQVALQAKAGGELERLRAELETERVNLAAEVQASLAGETESLMRSKSEAETSLQASQRELAQAQEQLELGLAELAEREAVFGKQQEAWRSEMEQQEALVREEANRISHLEQQLLDSQRRLEEERAELQGRLQKMATEEAKPGKVVELPGELARERAELEALRVEWQVEQEQKESSLQQEVEALRVQQQEHEAACEKLYAEQKEFDRFLTIDATQRKVLSNLNKIRLEKSPLKRFFLRLLRPFRRSD